MKHFLLLFSILGIFATAQNQRFAYEYTYIADSTNRDKVEKELMYLDITKDGSKFYSRPVYVSDSTMKANFEKEIKATGSMNVTIKSMSTSGKIRDKVFKNYPNYNTFLITKIGIDAYKVLDDQEIVWKILPEREKIGEFMAQKAGTKMFGRIWTAWFSSEIPLQDGPYKFHGLPGLIVKISDASNSHVFDLKAATKFEGETENLADFYGGEKAIEINQKQYKKLYLDARNDPAKGLRQLIANSINIQLKDASGREMSSAEMIRNREKIGKENNLKNNNVLELDLLK